MKQQRAIQLESESDAIALHHTELEPCLTDDNGAPPDGSAWIMWNPDGDDLDETALAAFRAARIHCHMVDVFVTAYPHTGGIFTGLKLPEKPWMGHQTIGQAAFMHKADALDCERAMTERPAPIDAQY